VRSEQLSKSYAKAIYEAAFERWIGALGQVRDGIEADPQLIFELTDPNKSVDDKRALVRSLLPDVSVQEVENIVLLLSQDGRLDMLGEIISEFEQLVTLREQRVPAIVSTAVPLTEEENEAMVEKLVGLYGGRLDFEFVVDPEILGGVIVRVAGKVIDDSVAGKLAALRERLGVASR
jgi:F-type H+-transporting ATPase subunit delta